MKKIGIGIGILLLVVLLCIGTFTFLVGRIPDPCGEEWIADMVSPNQALKAIVFMRDCGATTDYSTQVAIVKVNIPLKDAGKSVFAAETDHGSASNGTGGGPEVQVRWLSDTRLEILYDPFARVTLAKPEAQSILVSYGTIP
jgi:hypothetical protein